MPSEYVNSICILSGRGKRERERERRASRLYGAKLSLLHGVTMNHVSPER
jgi:hypothetical protein